jgi:hypothetical protein
MPDLDSTAVETLPNMSSSLSQLYTDWLAGKPVDQTAETFGLEVEDDRVFVTLIMVDEPSAQEAISALPELGAEVTSSFEAWIDAWVPISELEKVAALPGISLVREVVKVLPIDPVPEDNPP